MDQACDPSELKDYAHNNNEKIFLFRVFLKIYLL